MPLTKTYTIGSRLSFRDKSMIEPYLCGGWSPDEANFRWTVGRHAKVRIMLDDAVRKGLVVRGQGLLLRVQCAAFLAARRLTHQSVDVLCNGVHVGTWVVREMAWHEALIKERLVAGGQLLLTFVVSHPTAPSEIQESTDTRQLGINVKVMELLESDESTPNLDDPSLEWLGKGEDPVGDVFRCKGKYFRAIKGTAAAQVRTLLDRGVYQQLASRRLIPAHVFVDVEHPKYAMVSSCRAGEFVYAASFSLRGLKDAAMVWLQINELLIDVEADEGGRFGLVDGHYGNFALFDNSQPMWIDIGSISREGGYPGDPRFGLMQFIRCYMFPLILCQQQPENVGAIHDMMNRWSDGISYAEFNALGQDSGLGEFNVPATHYIDRRRALRKIRAILTGINFDSVKGYWSGYRNVESLDWAVEGRWLESDQDPRFRAVIDLARRSGTSNFVDIGANDGLFSLLCARDGRKGIATDLDDFSLNKLCQFLAPRPDIELAVAHGSFLSIPFVAPLVLALAITHHLVISQNLSFAEISESLAKKSSRAVITEFMPDGLGGTAENPGPFPDPLPAGYTLEEFTTALRVDFDHVEVINYDRPNPSSRRILVYCEGPKRLAVKAAAA